MRVFHLIGRGLLSLASLLALAATGLAADPEVEVTGLSVTDSGAATVVNVGYRYLDADADALVIGLQASANDGLTWYAVPVLSLTGDTSVQATAAWTDGTLQWAAGADWLGQFSDQMRVRVTASDSWTYLVIDVTGGPDAVSYPVTKLAVLPNPIPDEYRTTKIVLRRIPASTFTMGSPVGELGRVDDRETQHEVTLTQDFYMGVFPVTQKQYERVMDTWPSYFNNTTYRDGRPVEMVSWDDVRGGEWPGGSRAPGSTTFLGKLRAKSGLAVDLPTEGQWEYACRAGTTKALNAPWDDGGRNLTATSDPCPNMAVVGRDRFNGGSGYSQGSDDSVGTAKVGSYLPNQWGLYDMHGNVLEWCLDVWVTNLGSDPVIDPEGCDTSSLRVLRGGGWNYGASGCRSANRNANYPHYRGSFHGFRICSAPPVQ